MLRSLLRAVTDFAFLFSFLSILFRQEVGKGYLLTIFFLGIAVSFFGTLLRRRSRLWPAVLLLFFPLLLQSGNAEGATLLLVTFIVSLLFILNDRGSLDYFYQIREFHLIVRVIMLYLAVTILLSGFAILEDRVIPYVIVYVFNTSVLLRILRHDEYLAGNVKNRAYNLGLAAGSLILTLILSVEGVRAFLAGALGATYAFLADIVFRILYTPLFLLYTAVDAFFAFIFSRFTPPETAPTETETGGVAGMYRNYNEGIEIIGASPYLKYLPGILLFLLTGYVLYRLFRRKRSFTYQEGAFSEERERMEKPERNGLFSRRGRDKDSVRGRYARYLQSVNKETPIRASDTSRDVLSKVEKAMAQPGKGPIGNTGELPARETLSLHEKIRNAYVRVRYAEGTLTREEEAAYRDAVDQVLKAREERSSRAGATRKRHVR